jgi:hypothetical protein
MEKKLDFGTQIWLNELSAWGLQRELISKGPFVLLFGIFGFTGSFFVQK